MNHLNGDLASIGMEFWHTFHGPNAGYILELYDRYQRDPNAVDAATRAYFESWTPPTSSAVPNGTATGTYGSANGIAQSTTNGSSNGTHSAVAAPSLKDTTIDKLAADQPPIDEVSIEKVVAATNLAQAIRDYGHMAAQLDPLGSKPPGDPSMLAQSHGISDEDLRQLPASIVGGPLAQTAANAYEAIQALRKVYSSTTGYDYDHIRIPAERAWLLDAAESRRFQPKLDEHAMLERLTQVEVFEQFLHRIFTGKHRFSIEGLDIMIPMLDDIVGASAGGGIKTILIGMAHRGRLNVLAHVLNKPYAQILAEFKDPVHTHTFTNEFRWTGDVKYHMGAQRSIHEGQPADLVITIAPNPSHLEAVNPVIEGMARAVGTRADQAGPSTFDPLQALPVVIHGDAAFPGQGVVAETLNLSRLPGYTTGGTVHIIANNQLGFTTIMGDGRSTMYASDLAKGFKIPIVHVNADDPEACIEVARLAFAFRAHFQKDFLIDLIGYRRYGHNEADEPVFTQPEMYQDVQKQLTVRQLWANTLIQRGIVTEAEAQALVDTYMERLRGVLAALDPQADLKESRATEPIPGMARNVKTAVAMEQLRDLNSSLLTAPEDFTFHPKLLKARQRRAEILSNPDEATIEWATAEELAFASILADGTPIRLTGQDVERGTFSQRHAVFHDINTGATLTPLQRLSQARAAFEIHNSPLSENAALGFEYGYNVQEPARLVLWEAQYGDFDNGGQVIIDEFITSARTKWGQTPSLVMLLPHGYEGAGPDHSSARLERFLQLAAETNLRIVNCTTAAQYFHLLRRQAALLINDPLPLIVMTPKSLLRHKMVASPLSDLADGRFQPVIDDETAQQHRSDIRRVLLCSGKIYIDLVSSRYRQDNTDIALVRVEQLYPFPIEELEDILDSYPNLEEIEWVQEEPENMGAWEFVRQQLRDLIGERFPIRYVGRVRSSSPAEGSSTWHALNQEKLIEQAYRHEIGKRETGLIQHI